MGAIDRKHPLMMDVINKHQENVPVDLEAIARDMGIRVHIDPNLDNDISGKITRLKTKRGEERFEITINGRHSRVRQRFTLAHELAHYILHRDDIGDGIVDDAMYRSAQTSDRMEREANMFAASMILPAPLVRRVYRDEGVKSIHLLSERFGVSEAAMRIRLIELRLAP